MLVKDVMRRAVCIDPQESVAAAARKLRDEHVSCLPVCRGAKLIGMLTDRDITDRVVAQGRAPNDITVREAMSVEALRCAPDDTVEQAACSMRQARVRRLVVVDRRACVVGIVSANDVGASDVAGCESKPLPFEVVFYKDVLDHFGHTHRSELMRVPVARGTREEAIRTAMREFEQTRQVDRWDALADGYDVICARVDS